MGRPRLTLLERAQSEHSRKERQRGYNKTYYNKTKGKRTRDQSIEAKKLVHVRMPDSLIGRIYRCVNEGLATGKYPWKTANEAINDLVVRGFGTMRGDQALVDEFWPHLEMMQQLERIHTNRREALAVLSKAKQEISELMGIGATQGAVNYFHITIEAAHKMPPTEWRDWLILQLNTAFPELAKIPTKGVALTRLKPVPAKKGALVRAQRSR